MTDLVKRLTLIAESKSANLKLPIEDFEEWQAAQRIEELEAENRIFRSTESVDDSVWDALLEQIRQHHDRIEELEARITDHNAEWVEDQQKLVELQRKYEALVDGITSAQLHTSETLRLLQWDQLGWDVPEEVIESLGKADSELRALLEDDK